MHSANTYTKVTTGSKCVAIVIKSQMAVPITIGKGIKIVWVVAANRVPPVEVMLGILDKLNEIQGIQQTQMTDWKEKGYDIPPPARFIRTGGMVWSKSHVCSCPAHQVPQHLLAKTWRVGMHKPCEAWDLGCWWWTFQGDISENPTSYGWGIESLTWRKCWKQVLYTLVKAHGVTLLSC